MEEFGVLWSFKNHVCLPLSSSFPRDANDFLTSYERFFNFLSNEVKKSLAYDGNRNHLADQNISSVICLSNNRRQTTFKTIHAEFDFQQLQFKILHQLASSQLIVLVQSKTRICLINCFHLFDDVFAFGLMFFRFGSAFVVCCEGLSFIIDMISLSNFAFTLFCTCCRLI
jgi:hypothetical protein